MSPAPHSLAWGIVGCVALGAGCVADLRLPEPPPMVDRERAYDEPTALLSRDTAEDIIARYLLRSAQIDDLGGLRPVARSLVALDSSVEVEEETGTLQIKKVPIRTDALLDLWIDCPGDGSDKVRDAIHLQVVVEDSHLVPVAWGEIDGCRVAVAREGAQVLSQFSGDIAAFVPTLLEKGGKRKIYLAFSIRNWTVAEEQIPPFEHDLRLVGDAVEIRVMVADAGHVVVFVDREESELGVRAANGDWVCSEPQRQCASLDGSRSFSF